MVALPLGGILDPNDESVSATASGQAWIAGYAGVSTGALSPFAAPVPVVPEVTSLQARSATSALAASGLTSTQNQTTSCPPYSFGVVLSQNPAAGLLEPFGSTVTLTVCIAKVTVPNVTGLADASARNALFSAGLRVGTVTLTANCTVPRGTVLSQNPEAAPRCHTIPRST